MGVTPGISASTDQIGASGSGPKTISLVGGPKHSGRMFKSRREKKMRAMFLPLSMQYLAINKNYLAALTSRFHTFRQFQ